MDRTFGEVELASWTQPAAEPERLTAVGVVAYVERSLLPPFVERKDYRSDSDRVTDRNAAAALVDRYARQERVTVERERDHMAENAERADRGWRAADQRIADLERQLREANERHAKSDWARGQNWQEVERLTADATATREFAELLKEHGKDARWKALGRSWVEQDQRIAELERQLRESGAELERERMRLAACGTAALGYFEGCADEYWSASLGDVLRLRERETRLRSAAQALVDYSRGRLLPSGYWDVWNALREALAAEPAHDCPERTLTGACELHRPPDDVAELRARAERAEREREELRLRNGGPSLAQQLRELLEQPDASEVAIVSRVVELLNAELRLAELTMRFDTLWCAAADGTLGDDDWEDVRRLLDRHASEPARETPSDQAVVSAAAVSEQETPEPAEEQGAPSGGDAPLMAWGVFRALRDVDNTGDYIETGPALIERFAQQQLAALRRELEGARAEVAGLKRKLEDMTHAAESNCQRVERALAVLLGTDVRDAAGGKDGSDG